MRKKKPHSVTSVEVPGEHVVGDLLRKNIILFPVAIDPLGGTGPMFDKFLLGRDPRTSPTFPDWRPNAAEMYRRATNFPCPLDILTCASVNWQQTKTRRFYGHSYTAPNPTISTVQQIGLSITKAFALHLRNSTRKMNAHPAVPAVAPPPPGFEPIDIDINFDDISVDSAI